MVSSGINLTRYYVAISTPGMFYAITYKKTASWLPSIDRYRVISPESPEVHRADFVNSFGLKSYFSSSTVPEGLEQTLKLVRNCRPAAPQPEKGQHVTARMAGSWREEVYSPDVPPGRDVRDSGQRQAEKFSSLKMPLK